jgi:hypothetical protein
MALCFSPTQDSQQIDFPREEFHGVAVLEDFTWFPFPVRNILHNITADNQAGIAATRI